MTVRIAKETNTLEHITAARHICRNCSQLEPVDENGFCRQCSDEIEECRICRREYSLSGDYIDVNVCPDCNPYYGKFNDAVSCFSALQNDILSLFRAARCFKGIDGPGARELFRKVVKAIFNARKIINGEVGYERDNRKGL
jgi:hypothetical protein